MCIDIRQHPRSDQNESFSRRHPSKLILLRLLCSASHAKHFRSHRAERADDRKLGANMCVDKHDCDGGKRCCEQKDVDETERYAPTLFIGESVVKFDT